MGANSSGGYNITDSLRFRSSASSYLSRTPTTSGNRKTFTISCWVKRSKLGATQRLFQAKDSASGAYEGIEINSSDQFKLRHHSGAFYEVTTTQVFRDTSAWYHLVATVDTTQATSSNRIKLYVNGEQVTSFATASYPAQNYDFPINDTQEHTIGTYPTGGGEFFDGYMTEVNFVDGQALTPSDFGETNADGVWSPKKYTGTYGTNGFYLPMKETTQATGFNTVLWTGNGTSQSISGVGFSPDLVWTKERNGTSSHMLFDTIRGAGYGLRSELTNAEFNDIQTVSSIDSDGFSVGNSLATNESGLNHVAWCWDAGSSTVSNTDGDITASVRANPATGFSILTYTGNGASDQSIGHGLSTAPKVLICKERNNARLWDFTYTCGDGSYDFMQLNTTNAKSDITGRSAPTDSLIYVSGANSNTNASTYVAYCFSEVSGFSKFGSYTGNGSTSGPTVTTGFRPAFVMVKSSTLSPSQWTILDNTRSPSNPTDKVLYPNLSNAEADFDSIDFLDDGFQIKNTSGSNNSSGQTYIYMAFADTRDYQWNFDASGNKNNWTPNNINSNASSETTYDLMSDVPSLADEDTSNFCTLNPLHRGTASFAKNGNLTYYSDTSTSYSIMGCSIAVSSGKWYWELKCISGATPTATGIMGSSVSNSSLNTYLANLSTGYVYISNGYKGNNNVQVPYGDTITYGDTIGVALDLDNGAIYFSKNGVWQNSGDPTSGATATGAAYTGLSGEFVPAVSDHGGAGVTEGDINFGQRPFKYTPPTGYKKLNTYNLPDSSITDGSQYMNPVLWTGTGTTTSFTGMGFSPDLVWLKRRDTTSSNFLVDSVRGASKALYANDTTAEVTRASAVTSFDSDGWSMGSDFNTSGASYVTWGWRGSDSTAVSNTDGTITSTVSANPTSGFSVVTWTGNGVAGATIGHGLGTAPSVVITKGRSYAQNWAVYHSALGPTKWLQLNSTVAQLTETAIWNNTAPTSSVFTHGSSIAVNPNGGTNVSYCFAEVEGFSKFGSYTGNGSTDGPFVYTGFRPAFILEKNANSAFGWLLWDTSRSAYNMVTKYLVANTSGAEVDTLGASGPNIDILSNGFKVRDPNSGWNQNGSTHIYMAFAENPFKNSLAR